jgi:hypothetical protein
MLEIETVEMGWSESSLSKKAEGEKDEEVESLSSSSTFFRSRSSYPVLGPCQNQKNEWTGEIAPGNLGCGWMGRGRREMRTNDVVEVGGIRRARNEGVCRRFLSKLCRAVRRRARTMTVVYVKSEARC